MVAKVGGKLQMDKMGGRRLTVEYCHTKCYVGRKEPTKENIAACTMLRAKGICPLVRLLQSSPKIECTCRNPRTDYMVKDLSLVRHKTNAGDTHLPDCTVTTTYGY